MAEYMECKPRWNVHLGKGRSRAGRRSLDGIHGQGNQDQSSLKELLRPAGPSFRRDHQGWSAQIAIAPPKQYLLRHSEGKWKKRSITQLSAGSAISEFH